MNMLSYMAAEGVGEPAGKLEEGAGVAGAGEAGEEGAVPPAEKEAAWRCVGWWAAGGS